MLNNNLVPVKLLADEYGMSADTIRQRIRKGGVEAVKVGRIWLVNLNDFVEYHEKLELKRTVQDAKKQEKNKKHG